MTSIPFDPANCDSLTADRNDRLIRNVLFLATFLLVWVTTTPFADLSNPKLLDPVGEGNLTGQILDWLPAAGYAPPGLFERAAFRLRMHGGLVSAPAYLMRLSLSPTEEDWGAGGEENRRAFLEVLRRPFRLARKYGRARKS